MFGISLLPRRRLTRVDEAVHVLHHQFAAQADGVLEVGGGHVPVGVLAAATLQPQRHDGQQQLDDREDGEARTWRGGAVMLGGGDGAGLRMRAGASPGTTVTSRSSVKSSSSVGGWCCRGQVDTAAVSCSSSRIHTWIRPVWGQGTPSGGHAREGRDGGGARAHPCRRRTPAGRTPPRPPC